MNDRPAFYIGTSGWNYRHWKGPFYPPGLRATELLPFYRERFSTVEVNNSFYILPSIGTFAAWRRDAGDDFRFAVKASRFITHMKKLKDPEEPIARLLGRVQALGPALGPILFQLPPRWRYNRDRLEHFLAVLPSTYRFAIEFREPSWWNDDVYDLLRRSNVAFCIFDLAGRQSPPIVTADFVYVRLHGPEAAYQGRYGRERLALWLHRFREWSDSTRDLYCYFDNDQNGYAPQDALELNELVRSNDGPPERMGMRNDAWIPALSTH